MTLTAITQVATEIFDQTTATGEMFVQQRGSTGIGHVINSFQPVAVEQFFGREGVPSC